MRNSRITNKERNALKGAVRRVFSRSELRLLVLKASTIKGYADSKRPRVTRWSSCNLCKVVDASYKMNVDHIDPIIPVDNTLEGMSWDTVIDRTWCESVNLQVLCEGCHKEKTKKERKERTLNKRKAAKHAK